MALGYNFQQLPLGLKSISIVSYTYLYFMVFILFDTEGFSKWVDWILLSIDLLKLDIISIHDLLDQEVATQYMLGALMGL